MSSPICSQCDAEYNPRRAALGYKTCLDCGSPPAQIMFVEVSKSNSIITSDPRNLTSVALPGWTGRSDPSGNGNYMRLGQKS